MPESVGLARYRHSLQRQCLERDCPVTNGKKTLSFRQSAEREMWDLILKQPIRLRFEVTMTRTTPFRSNIRTASVGLAFLGLAIPLSGCSGSGSEDGSSGTGSMPPPISNSDPALLGAQAFSIDENATSIGTISATDSDGDTLSFAISGDDATLFSINSGTGALSFDEAPDFENPLDLDRNNQYTFDVTVSDSFGGSVTGSVTVDVLNVADTRYLEQIFEETETTGDILYATVDGQDLVLNIVTSVGDTETNRPFILFATGGGFFFTDRSLSLPFAEAFARAGYVTAVMDYRTTGLPQPTGLDFQLAAIDATHDMAGAVRFIRANAQTYGIDPDKIIVSGNSAGGFMAATLATMDPTDALPDDIQSYLDTVGGVYGQVGDHLDQSSIVQGALSYSGAIFDLDTIDLNSAPIYGAHEELDTVAPCGTVTSAGGFTASGTCDFVPAYQVLGVPAESFIVLGDTGHVDFSDEEYEQIRDESLAFFLTHVIQAD